MERNTQTSPGRRTSKFKLWCWVLGIIAVSVLAVIVFCHVVYWLIWIGAITVIAIVIAIAVMVTRGMRRLKDDID